MTNATGVLSDILNVPNLLDNRPDKPNSCLPLVTSPSVTPNAVLGLHSCYIHKLPAELIYEIFLHVLGDLSKLVVTLDSGAAPWPLGWVCSQWRDVLHSSPTFWNRVDIKLDRESMVAEGREAQIATILRGSGRLPLTMTFSSLESESFVPFIDLIADESSRWKKAFLAVSHNFLQRLQRTQGKMPILRDLTVQRVAEGDGGLRTGLIRAFKVAPMLKTAKLVNIAAHEIYLPLRRVQSMTTSAAAEIDPMILHFAPKLVHYTHESGELRIPARNSMITSLDKLRTIVLSGEACRDIPLRVPNLRDARFNFTQNQSLDGVVSLFGRSKCENLRELYLLGEFAFGEQLLQVLEAVPSLEKLTILHMPYGEQDLFDNDQTLARFVDALTHKKGEASLAPNLRSIDVDIAVSEMTFDSNSVRIMWDSRQRMASDSEENLQLVVRLEDLNFVDAVSRIDVKSFII